MTILQAKGILMEAQQEVSTQECTCCKKAKPIDQFVYDPLCGRADHCIDCSTAHERGCKVCRGCKEEKPLSEFGKQAAQKDGLHIYCKKCASKKSVAWKKANPEKHAIHQEAWEARDPEGVRLIRNAAAKKWRDTHPEQFVAIYTRRNAERRVRTSAPGSDKNITASALHVLDDGVCQLCLLECSLDEATVDHIQPLSREGSHTWGNVQLAHFSCNSSKGDKTMDEYWRGLGLQQGKVLLSVNDGVLL